MIRKEKIDSIKAINVWHGEECYICDKETKNGSMNKYQFKVGIGLLSIGVWTQWEYRCEKHDV